MKKRYIFLLVLCLLLCLSNSVFAENTADETVAVSTSISDLALSGNCGSHYVRGNGMRHSPARSWLHANEKGGVTLVQYLSASRGVTVAEFDSQLQFVNTRSIPVTGIKTWGGFYAGPDYYYFVYSTGSNTLRIDQYDKDWSAVNTKTYTLGNTNSLISNDLDITGGGGKVYIVSNHYMSNGHQANFRLQVDADTLALLAEQTGTADYSGYCSHSFVPEVVYSGGTVYAFDRCDSYPGTALYMSVFNGSFYAGSGMRSVKSMRFNDWGSQGNAIPASGSGVLTAYTFAPYNQANTTTDVYLYYASPSVYGSSTRVSYTGGAGTPYVVSVSDSYGFVLWNPDLYDRTQQDDDLYCAVYALNGSSLTVGPARKTAGHSLSDCEPIRWDGGLLWFSYSGGELTFHQINGGGKVSKTALHKPVTITGKPATCTETGLTDGQQCSLCKEVLVEQTVVDMLPHTEIETPYVAPTLTSVGYTAGVKCQVCDQQLFGHETIPQLEAAVETVVAENQDLQVTFRGEQAFFAAVAYFDEQDRCIGVSFHEISLNAQSSRFHIPAGSCYFRIFLTDEQWTPLRDTYDGQF